MNKTAFVAPTTDFDFAAMLFNETHQEQTMDVIPTADNRRFTVTGKSTGFFGLEVLNLRRFGGRFGGDAGNRKRREEHRHDDTVEHTIRVRAEKRAAVEAIVAGLEEYEASRRPVAVSSSIHADRKDKRGKNRRSDRNSRCGTEAREFDFGFEPRHERPRFDAPVPEGMVRNTRTGHLVPVAVKLSPRARRAREMAGMVAASRRMSNDDIRAAMGLAPKN